MKTFDNESKLIVKVDNKKIRVYGLTDIHVGNEAFHRDFFEQVLAEIKKDKDAYFFINGDAIEFIPPNYDISERGQDRPNEQQKAELIGYLRPIKDKCLFYRPGNHEDRSEKIAGFDIVWDICRELNIPMYKEPGYLTIQTKSGKITIVSAHGSSGGGVSLADSEIQRLTTIFPNADVYFLGHNHQLRDTIKKQIELDDSGKETNKYTYLIRGGSFVQYKGYSRKKILPPATLGCYVIEFDGKIDIKKITEEQFVPVVIKKKAA